MSEWKKARKKPVVIEFREVNPKLNSCKCSICIETPCEQIDTKEGILMAVPKRDFIIKGVDGELYPIDKKIFVKTYEVIIEGEKK
jgi:hypothetical protein